jgi:hypothetical protein
MMVVVVKNGFLMENGEIHRNLVVEDQIKVVKAFFGFSAWFAWLCPVLPMHVMYLRKME